MRPIVPQSSHDLGRGYQEKLVALKIAAPDKVNKKFDDLKNLLALERGLPCLFIFLNASSKPGKSFAT
jgi:hypothetical protein